MTRTVVPVMRRQGGGAIINVGSTAGIRPRPGLTWYNGSKAAVNLLSRSMAVELAPDRIRVNCVAPVMGGRLSRPHDVANACLYLASDEAEFITGVVLEVDGGRTV